MSNFGEAEQEQLRRMLMALEAIQPELGLPHVIALLQISLEPGLSVNDLAERLKCPQQTASRYVSTLLGRYSIGPDLDATRSKLDSLISQEISQVDPRRRALFLSTSGRTMLKKLISQTFSGAKK